MPSPSRASRLAVLLSLAGVALPPPAASQSEQQGPPPAERSVRDGVYTDSQGERGREAYGWECASCHGTDLRGGEGAPGLVGRSFVGRWSGRTLGELYDSLRATMPQDRPGGLGDSAYLDLLAFLLAANRFPPGPQELPAGPEELRRILFEPRDP